MGSRRLCHECICRIVPHFHLLLDLLVPAPSPDDPQPLAWALGAHRPQHNSFLGPQSSSVVCQEILWFFICGRLGRTCCVWSRNGRYSVGEGSHRCHPQSLFGFGNCPSLCERCPGCKACHQWRQTVLLSP